MRPTVTSLITQDLGYCCPWFFFRMFRRSVTVADRLGVTVRAVQKAKAAAAESGCSNCEKCMRQKVTLAGTVRKLPAAPLPGRSTDTPKK